MSRNKIKLTTQPDQAQEKTGKLKWQFTPTESVQNLECVLVGSGPFATPSSTLSCYHTISMPPITTQPGRRKRRPGIRMYSHLWHTWVETAHTPTYIRTLWTTELQKQPAYYSSTKRNWSKQTAEVSVGWMHECQYDSFKVPMVHTVLPAKLPQIT